MKRKPQANIPYEHWCKNPQQNTSKLNPAAIHDQVGFILVMPGGSTYEHWWVQHATKCKKEKAHTIILIDAKKAFDIIQRILWLKTLNRLEIGGKYLSKIIAIYGNPQRTSYSIVKNWKLFPHGQEWAEDVYFCHFHST
jgi:hypothetical protein